MRPTHTLQWVDWFLTPISVFQPGSRDPVMPLPNSSQYIINSVGQIQRRHLRRGRNGCVRAHFCNAAVIAPRETLLISNVLLWMLKRELFGSPSLNVKQDGECDIQPGMKMRRVLLLITMKRRGPGGLRLVSIFPQIPHMYRNPALSNPGERCND